MNFRFCGNVGSRLRDWRCGRAWLGGGRSGQRRRPCRRGAGDLRRNGRCGYGCGSRGGRLGRFALAQESTGDAQSSFRLFHINGFCEHQIGADAECLRDSGLSLNHRDRERRLIDRGTARALEQQGGILVVIAVDHDGVEMLGHQFLDGGERLDARFDGKLQLAQDLRHCAGDFFVGTEEKSSVTHTKVIVGTAVRGGKLRQ